MLRALPLLVLLLFLPSAASATLIAYAARLEAGGEPFVNGLVIADDAGFFPGAIVPLANFALTFDPGPELTVDWRLAGCGGTATGLVDGAGADLTAVSLSCEGTDVGATTLPTIEMALDGTFVMEVVPGIVIIPGTYTLERVGVPAPGPTALLASAAVWFLGFRRRRRRSAGKPVRPAPGATPLVVSSGALLFRLRSPRR